MSTALKQLDDLVGAARTAEDYRRRAAMYRDVAAAETAPHVVRNATVLAESYEEKAAALAPQVSRLRRAVAALEAALADDQ